MALEFIVSASKLLEKFFVLIFKNFVLENVSISLVQLVDFEAN